MAILLNLSQGSRGEQGQPGPKGNSGPPGKKTIDNCKVLAAKLVFRRPVKLYKKVHAQSQWLVRSK